jgi:hypothetical protein
MSSNECFLDHRFKGAVLFGTKVPRRGVDKDSSEYQYYLDHDNAIR